MIYQYSCGIWKGKMNRKSQQIYVKKSHRGISNDSLMFEFLYYGAAEHVYMLSITFNYESKAQ
jgi:hypothetical protein